MRYLRTAMNSRLLARGLRHMSPKPCLVRSGVKVTGMASLGRTKAVFSEQVDAFVCP